MKKLIILVLTSLFSTASFSQNKMVLDTTKKLYQLQAACGTCKFKLKGDDCALAVMYKDYPYFVEGTGIDDHGDAHSKNGFCNAVRMAEVQGELVGNKFVVTYFKLVEEPKQQIKQQ